MKTWMKQTAARCAKAFASNGVEMTLGGEPTYVPIDPEGPEWSYAAVGPTKLGYARKMAAHLITNHIPGGIDFFSPGKSYPGELDPRWAVRLISNKDGSPLFRSRQNGLSDSRSMTTFRKILARALGVKPHWKSLKDPNVPSNRTWALVLDEVNDQWASFPWPPEALELTQAIGPAGLRLPLHTLKETIPRRAVTLEWSNGLVSIFLPPLLQAPFVKLLKKVDQALRESGMGLVEMQGYIPYDEADTWTQIGLAADPGVLEVNLPACKDWEEYDYWLRIVTLSAEACGLRSWKTPTGSPPEGSGGGNHLVFGGRSLDTNPFFSRPRWLTSILRYWQHHPSLAYMFTGCYVGASSQAPRADESARDLHDLEMAFSFLESLPPGDHRHAISETLRHLQTDVTGNSHRSEISLDKFWNLTSPSGALGLIEFRAIESLPKPEWMSAVALLWTALAAWLLENPSKEKLRQFSTLLHDRYLLPCVLWNDLTDILNDLNAAGFGLDAKTFRDIWEWKFPAILDFRSGGAQMTIRRAHESWPLLCEMPVNGGTTSRFVDTSMQRLEVAANPAFEKHFAIRFNGRPLRLRHLDRTQSLAGLRYRRTNLYPSLHPGIPPQLPLQLDIVGKGKSSTFLLEASNYKFKKSTESPLLTLRKPCKAGRSRDWTCDLRLG